LCLTPVMYKYNEIGPIIDYSLLEVTAYDTTLTGFRLSPVGFPPKRQGSATRGIFSHIFDYFQTSDCVSPLHRLAPQSLLLLYGDRLASAGLITKMVNESVKYVLLFYFYC